MKEIKLDDFKILPDLNSLKRVDMSDDEYFSDKYKDYVSNSRLKLINPEEGGSPEKYKNPPKFTSSSLSMGSVVHEQMLQKEYYEMAPKLGRPSAKLGNCIDEIIKLRQSGIGGYRAVEQAMKNADYYANSINEYRIKDIIKKGLKYYFARKKYKGNHVSIHILTNARSGNCSQDCAYCAQSCRSKAEIEKYKWVSDEKLYQDNDLVSENHLSRHCIRLSGIKFTDKELKLPTLKMGSVP